VDKGFKKVCYSKAIEGYLKTIGIDIKGMGPKHPYKEAYFWKDI